MSGRSGVGFNHDDDEDRNGRMIIQKGLQRSDLSQNPSFKVPDNPKRSLLGLDRLAKEKEAEREAKRAKIEAAAAKTPVVSSGSSSTHSSSYSSERDRERDRHSSSSSSSSVRRPSSSYSSSTYDRSSSSSSRDRDSWDYSSRSTPRRDSSTPQRDSYSSNTPRRDSSSTPRRTGGPLPLPSPKATPTWKHNSWASERKSMRSKEDEEEERNFDRRFYDDDEGGMVHDESQSFLGGNEDKWAKKEAEIAKKQVRHLSARKSAANEANNRWEETQLLNR
jgi:hypothetical protein